MASISLLRLCVEGSERVFGLLGLVGASMCSACLQ